MRSGAHVDGDVLRLKGCHLVECECQQRRNEERRVEQRKSQNGYAHELLARALGGFEAGDLTVFETVMAPDVVVRNPSGVMRGPAELAERVREAFVNPFSDRHIEIVDAIESGEGIAAEIRTTARHTGTMRLPGRELPATNNAVTIEEASMVRVNGDKIVSWHSYYDLLAVLRQLGLELEPVR